MCYADTYQCTISCINSDLNITEAMNGTITGMYPYAGLPDTRCHVTSCQIIEHLSGGAITQTLPEPNYVALAIGVALVVCGVIIIYLNRRERS